MGSFNVIDGKTVFKLFCSCVYVFEFMEGAVIFREHSMSLRFRSRITRGKMAAIFVLHIYICDVNDFILFIPFMQVVQLIQFTGGVLCRLRAS